jgi:hypothetical protein
VVYDQDGYPMTMSASGASPYDPYSDPYAEQHYDPYSGAGYQQHSTAARSTVTASAQYGTGAYGYEATSAAAAAAAGAYYQQTSPPSHHSTASAYHHSPYHQQY